MGGFTTGKKEIIDMLRQRSRPYLFSNSVAPAIIGASPVSYTHLSNAFSAIFDSNLTSIITGIILFYFGTGPIRGFATTLIIGIPVSYTHLDVYKRQVYGCDRFAVYDIGQCRWPYRSFRRCFGRMVVCFRIVPRT